MDGELMSAQYPTLFAEAVDQKDGLFVFEGRHPQDRTTFVAAVYDKDGNELFVKTNEGRLRDVEYGIALVELSSRKSFGRRIR
jgi:hypothetical protein